MAIIYEVGFKVDQDDLKRQLSFIDKEIQKIFNENVLMGGITKELNAGMKAAGQLQAAMLRATTDKGISYSKLNIELAKAKTSAVEMAAALSGAGMTESFNALLRATASANRNITVMNDKLKEMGRVLTQSIKFNAAMSLQNLAVQQFQRGIVAAQQLDKSLTDISIVTGIVGDELDDVFTTIEAGAKKLKVAADDYAQASLIYYQQGLVGEELTRRTETTVKAARAARVDVEAMSEQLTAIWNTYSMPLDQIERAASIAANLGAKTAVDMGYIAEAMQTAAAPAAQLGVDYEQLASIIATVGETTMQTASVVGTSFKTIFARFNQLVTDGTDGEVTLGRVSQGLLDLGINILDADGQLIDLGETLNFVGQNWSNWSREQQIAISQLAGGTRQYGQFLALMNNYDKYMNNSTAAYAENTQALEEQNQIAMDSIETMQAELEETWRRAFADFFDSDTQKDLISTMTGVGEAVEGITSAFEGVEDIALILLALFNKKLVASMGVVKKSAVDMWGQSELKAMITGVPVLTRIYDDFNKKQQQMLADQKAMLSAGTITQGQYDSNVLNIRATTAFGQQNAKNNYKMRTADEATKVTLRGYNQSNITQMETIAEATAVLDEVESALKKNQALERGITKEKKEQYEVALALVRLAKGQSQDIDAIIANTKQAILPMQTAIDEWKKGNPGLIFDDFTGESLGLDMESYNDLSDKLEDLELRRGVTLDQGLGFDFEDQAEGITKASEALNGNAILLERNADAQKGLIKTEERLAEVTPKTTSKLKAQFEAFSSRAPVDAAQNISNAAFQTTLIISSFTSAVQAMGDESLSTGQKMMTLGTSLGMMIPSLLSLKTSFLALGGAALPITAVIAAVGIAVAAFTEYSRELEEASVEKTLERSREAALNLQTQITDLNNEIESLASNINSLEDIDDTFTKLAEGTKEWRDALREANNISSDLLSQYPELYNFGDGVQILNGRIEISTTALDALNEELALQAQAAKIAELKISRDISGLSAARDIMGILPEGTTLDYSEGVATRGFNFANNPDNANQFLEEYARIINEEGEVTEELARILVALNEGYDLETANLNNLQIEDAIDALIANKDSLDDLVQEMELSNNARAQEAEAIATDLLNTQTLASDVANEITKAGGNFLNQELDRFTNEVEQEAIYNKNISTLLDEFATSQRFQSITEGKITGNNIEYTATAADGSSVSASITREQLTAQVASTRAIEELNNILNNQIAPQINEMVTEGGASGALAAFLGGDTGNASIGDIVGATNLEALYQKYSNILAHYGYTTSEAFQEAFNESLPNAEQVKAALEESGINSSVFNEITANTGAALASALTQATLGASGESGKDDMVKFFNDILGQIKPEDITTIGNLFKDIDWSSWTAVEQVKNYLENIGYTLDNIDWVTYADEMRLANNALPITEYRTLLETLTAIHIIVDDLSFGDMISPEAYEQLIAYNKELEKYFLLLTNGEYRFIGEESLWDDTQMATSLQYLQKQEQLVNDYLNSGGISNWTSLIGQENTSAKDLIRSAGYTENQFLQSVADQMGYEESIGELSEARAEEFLKNVESYIAGVISGAVTDEYREKLASTAESFGELDEQLANGEITVKEYDKALQNVLLKQAEAWGLNADEVKDYADQLQAFAGQNNISQNLLNNSNLADQAAVSLSRFNTGMTDLNNNWEVWEAIFEDGIANKDFSTEAFQEAMLGAETAITNILGIETSENLSSQFIIDNLKLIENASNGSETALEKLRIAATKDIMVEMGIETDDAASDGYAFLQWAQGYFAEHDLEVGATIDSSEFYEILGAMIEASELSVVQINSILRGIGLIGGTQYETKQVSVEDYLNTYRGAGWSATSDALGEFSTTGSGMIEIRRAIAAVGNTNSWVPPEITGGSGSDADNSAADPKEFRERYANLNSEIDSLARTIDRLNEVEDQAYGRQRIMSMQAKNTELQKEVGLYSELADEAKAYLTDNDRREGIQFGNLALGGTMGDQGRLNQMLGAIGSPVTAAFNEYGNISNIEDIRDILQQVYDVDYRLLSAALEGSNDAFTALQEELEVTDGTLEAIIEQVNLVNESADTSAEALESAVEGIRTWLANKLAEVDYKMELRISLNDRDMRILEQTLGQIKEEAYATHMDGLKDQSGIVLENAKELMAASTRYFEILNNINNAGNEAWFKSEFGDDAWEEFRRTGTMTQEMADALGGTADEMISTIDEIYQLNSDMWAMFHNALDSYIEKFDSLLELYDSHASIIDSWVTIWDFAGDPWKDTYAVVDMLNKGIETQSSKVQGLQKKYELLNSQLGTSEELYQEALATYGEDNIITSQMYDEWQSLEAETLAAQADMMTEIAAMMTMIEEAAAKSAEIIANEFILGLDAIFATTDGGSALFDQQKAVDNFFMHENDVQFELGQMLRDIAGDMGNVTDPEILKNYEAWMKKVNDLKEAGVQMTETELEILKAEFELDKTRAEWQEQQQAKDTMRLARDASGNWSYVYSTDGSEEDTESDIEQQINNIEKMHRDAADEAADAWFETWLEYEDYVRNIDQDRYAESEEYREEVNARMALYQQQLDLYTGQINMHNAAIGRSFSEMSLSVITDMDDMTELNNKYQLSTGEMFEALEQNYEDFQDTASKNLEDLGIDMDDLKEHMETDADNIADANQRIEDSIEDLLKSAESHLPAISDEISAWAELWRDEIQSLIDMMNELIGMTQGELEGAAGSYNSDLLQKVFEEAEEHNQNNIFGGDKVGEDIGGAASDLYQNDEDFKNLVEQAAQGTGYSSKDIMDFIKSGGISYRDGKWQYWDESDWKMKDLPNDIWTVFEQWYKNGKQHQLYTGGLVKYPISGVSLAEKGPELVLNADDTMNFLNAIKLVREMVAIKLATPMSELSTQMFNGTTQQGAASDCPPLVIHADFPHVSAAAEIEAAFDNMVNRAAQYNIKK